MVAVGLLYRYGYFTQKLSAQERSRRLTRHRIFRKPPIEPVRDAVGNWATVTIPLPGVRDGPHLALPGGTYRFVSARRRLRGQSRGGSSGDALPVRRRLGEPSQTGDSAGIGGAGAPVAALRKTFPIATRVMRRFSGWNASATRCCAAACLTFAEALRLSAPPRSLRPIRPFRRDTMRFPEAMIRQYLSHSGGTGDRLGAVHRSGTCRSWRTRNEKFSMSVLACNLSQEGQWR